MSLEDFSREVMGRAPANRSAVDRMQATDDSGSSYDQQVMTVRLPFGVGLAVVVGLLFIAWASDDPAWTRLLGQIQAVSKYF